MKTVTVPAERLRVLVADDQPEVLMALALLLKTAGHYAETVSSPQALLSAASAGEFDLILMDLNYTRDTTSGREGLDLLETLARMRVSAPVIVMTAWSNVELAVEAMQRGAHDFIQKPWDNERLLSTIHAQADRAAEARRLSRRAQSDIEIARNVQQKLLPQKTKTMRTIDYAGVCTPAQAVGGDYYDYLDLGDGGVGFVLADIDGKGIGAALLMAHLHALFRGRDAQNLLAPGRFLPWLNGAFHSATAGEHYASLFFGVYDDRSRKLRYVNCGHHAPILVRSGGGVERLASTATLIGLFDEWSCEEAQVEIAPGDTLLMFSDGAVECGIERGQEFGDQRLVASLKAAREKLPVEVLRAIVEDLARFCGTHPEDDFTMVAVRGVNVNS